MKRDTIFISHATPDDNDFVRWLGTRLTGHGYKVWADLFELRGGTPFWNSIEEALRLRMQGYIRGFEGNATMEWDECEAASLRFRSHFRRDRSLRSTTSSKLTAFLRNRTPISVLG